MKVHVQDRTGHRAGNGSGSRRVRQSTFGRQRVRQSAASSVHVCSMELVSDIFARLLHMRIVILCRREPRRQGSRGTTLDGGLGKRSDASVCDEPRAGRAVCRCRVRGGPGPPASHVFPCDHHHAPAGAWRRGTPPRERARRGPVGHAHDHVVHLGSAGGRSAAARGSSNRVERPVLTSCA